MFPYLTSVAWEVPNFVLGTPVISNSVPDNQLLRQLGLYFTMFRPGLRGARLLNQITRGKLISHGRICMAGGGDSIRIASIVVCTANARDNSFIKVSKRSESPHNLLILAPLV
jgi:hypothetical protein